MTNWYVMDKNGKSQGPFTKDEVVQRMESGKILSSQLVWAHGMKTWEPIQSHFQFSVSFIRSNRIPLALHSAFFFLSGLSRLIFYSSIHTLSITSFFLIRVYWDEIEHTNAFWFACVFSYFLAILTGVLAAIESWDKGKLRFSKFGGTHGGLLKAYSLLLIIFLSSFVIYYLSQVQFFMRIEKERQAFSGYNIIVSNDNTKISLTGPIGPGMARKLKYNFSKHSKIEVIEINSAGGLMDEAMRVAKIIDKKKSLKLRAHINCDSACLIIFLAGEKRFADREMMFGFHAAEPIADMSSIYTEGVGQDVDAYLLKRGVPKEILIHGFSSETNKIYDIPAVKLYELGVIYKLLDESDEVP